VQVALVRGSFLTKEQAAVTLGRYRSRFLARQVWRPQTLDVARRALERCEAMLDADRPLSAIRRGDVEALVVRLSAELAPGTVRVTFQHLRTLVRSAMADGVLVVDPTLRIKLPARPAAELVIPTQVQLAALLEAARPGSGPPSSSAHRLAYAPERLRGSSWRTSTSSAARSTSAPAGQ
jgi:hypothetical protein